jgi:hypothetical protein
MWRCPSILSGSCTADCMPISEQARYAPRTLFVGGAAPKPPGFIAFFPPEWMFPSGSLEGGVYRRPAIPAAEPVARVASQHRPIPSVSGVPSIAVSIEPPGCFSLSTYGHGPTTSPARYLKSQSVKDVLEQTVKHVLELDTEARRSTLKRAPRRSRPSRNCNRAIPVGTQL